MELYEVHSGRGQNKTIWTCLTRAEAIDIQVRLTEQGIGCEVKISK